MPDELDEFNTDPVGVDEPEIGVLNEPITYSNVMVTITPMDQGDVTGEEELDVTGGTDLTGGLTGDSFTISRDSAKIKINTDSATESPEGFTVFPGVVIAKEMIQPYADASGNTIQVYKPPDALRAILDHGENKPITDEHPPGQIVQKPSQIRGYVTNLAFNDSNELLADLVITCPVLAKKVLNDGQDEVSIGFYSMQQKTAGTFNDAGYDEIQTEILLDHVAMTKNGRCSKVDGCGIVPATRRKVIVRGGDSLKINSDNAQLLKTAQKVIDNNRIDTIAFITARTDAYSKEELVAMSTDELAVAKRMVADSSAIGINDSGNKPLDTQKIIDDAYSRKD